LQRLDERNSDYFIAVYVHSAETEIDPYLIGKLGKFSPHLFEGVEVTRLEKIVKKCFRLNHLEEVNVPLKISTKPLERAYTHIFSIAVKEELRQALLPYSWGS